MRTTTQLRKLFTACMLGVFAMLSFTSSAQCPDATITIEIFTDNYPEDINWELVDQNTGATIGGDDLSISGAPNTLYTWNSCVSATGCYDFYIFDLFGDGICCAEGFGYYNVYFNGVLEATGGSYLDGETVASIGGCSAGGCPEGTMVLQIQTDNYPTETEWQLIDTTTGAIVASDDLAVGGTANTLYTWNICVSNNGCYEFIISDGAGDGICCGFGNGFYNLTLNGNIIKTGGSFAFSETTNFGSCQSSGGCGTCQSSTPPLNDACSGATNLGILNAPFACPIGLGSAQTFSGTTLCATAEFPYGYIIGCQTGGDMSAPAADVWYRFQITGTELQVQVNSAMRGVSVGLWQDAGSGCIGLVARNCAETTLGGNLNTTFTALNPGIYYLQISGLDTLDQCDFTLALTNNEDCDACIQQNNLTASPAPVNGRFQAGTTVTFTYTIIDYNQTSVNWIHGIVPRFGAGWDLSTLTGQIPPQSCDADGSWGWYNQVITGTAFGVSDGPGFFFESSLGCSFICDPNNPGDNYGDEGVSIFCPLTFQWTITTTASCPPGQNGDDLGIEIFNYGDSETGSWTQLACQSDPNYNFFARLFCCDSSDITVQNISCSGGNTGSITVQGNGIAPYDYELLNQNGVVIQSSLSDADNHTFAGLSPGTYTVRTLDENNCTDVQVIQLTSGAPLLVIGVVTNVSCNGGSDGAIDISVAGGSAPYTYDWNGVSGEDRTNLTAGSYTVQVFDVNQCAGTATFVVSEPAPIANTIVPVQICEGQSYFAGGSFQTESGTYFDNLVTLAGCDSVVETQLTVSSVILAQVNVSICDGESYFAGGADQTESGLYDDSLQTSDGCDSIVETQLNVLPNAFTQLAVSICDGQSYFTGGDFQTESGIYFDTYTSANGCDSTVETTLTVLAGFIENQSAFICDGDSLFVGGAFQTESGIYFDSLLSTGGCDSVVITELTVGTVVVENATASICAGDSLFVGGAFQTESGIYADSFQTASGCDSVLLTELTVLSTASATVAVSICDGESFFVGGADQTTSGTYTDTYTSANGCDSIVTTELTVLPLASSTVAVSICDGESFFVGGADQTTSGTYTDTYTSANGCDSMVTTELTVLPLASSTVAVSICDGESFFVGGTDQTTSGTYTDTYTAANGCDSVVTTELTVLPNASSNVTVSICDGDSYFVGGADQTEKGTYFDTLLAANGCDSVVITELDVLPNSFTTLQVSICAGDSYFVGGADQTEAGTYFDTFVAANGCDSIVATDLFLIAPTQGFTSASICEGDSYFVGGADQTEAGFYTDTLVGANGCDSILTTQLTVIPPSGGNTQASICEGESYFVGGADQTESGFYFDTLVGANGCDSILVTELIVIEPVFGNAVVSICNGDSYFVGGADQTQPGFYVDVFTAASGCDSIVTTQLIVLPNPSFTQNISVCAGEGVFAGGAFQTTSGTYTDTYTASNGCDSVVTTVLTVGEELDINFDVNEVSCCTGNGSGNPGTQPCAFDITGLAHGTHVDSLFIASGTTVVAIPNSGGRPDAVIYNTNGNWSEDIDLNSNAGNVIIINENPNNNDGDGTGPDDNGSGGTLRFLFSDVVTVVSFVAVDVDKTGAIANAYDASNNLIAAVAIPQGADGSVQTISVNAPGTKRFDIIYRDSGGFRLNLECSQNCEQDLSGYAHGEIVTGQEIAPGVTVTGISNTPATSPNAVAIFNSNVSNSLDPDLEVGVGNLLILPQNSTDNNGDGNIDNPSDGNNGGKMIFTFDQDRTVYSLTLVDNDRNNGTVKAYDANNNLLLNVGTPSLGPSTIQLVSLNVSGVRKLEVSYWDSRGVTDLVLDCLDDEPCCDGNATANVTGGFPPYQFAWSTGATASYSGDSLCVGTYTVTVTDALGCSTTESVSLVTATVTTQSLTICDGESILLEGALQTKSGFYYDTLGVNDGCFEILKTELIVLPASSATAQVSICEGQSYFAGGANQTESGTYVDVFTAANGCDSTLTTELTVLPAFTSQADVTICEGQSYFAGGTDQTESGTYQDVFTTSGGCDSIVTTVLTVLPAFTAQVDAQICEGQSYFAGGADQTESGTYTDAFITASGCDSIVTTVLTVVPTAAQNMQVAICAGESYFAGGALQTESGFYIDSFTSGSGCDSIVITELTVTSPLLSGSTTHASCFGSSDGVVDLSISGGVAPFTFIWSNNTTKEDLVGATAGTYSVTVVDASGCSATETFTVNEPLPLSLGAVPTPVTCFGGSDGSIDLLVLGGTAPYTYVWNTGEFTEDISGLEAGFYTVEVTDANNCEAIVIVEVLQPEPALSSVQVTICEGESFFVGGADQTVSGTYFDTLVSPLGCDSIVITDLSVLPVVTSNAQATICEGQNYFAGGDFQTQSGIYFDTLTATSGCDSILITELTVLPASTSTLQVSICAGESYFAGGDFQTESGIYADSFATSNGCDSIVITELAVLPESVSSAQVSICTGQSYFAGGDFQTQSGIYFDSLISVAGCDSVVVTELTVLTSLTSIVEVSICEGQSYLAGGADQTESGTYFDTLTANGGCDSVVVTELTVLPASSETVNVSICAGESYFAGGDFQTESGIYFDPLTTAGGCDSILITELTVLPASSETANISICAGESYFAGGDFQTESGTYFDTLSIAGGCDSILITELTVLPTSASVVDAQICEGQSYFAGGDFQTESGTYIDVFTSSNGCDSVVTTNLTVSTSLTAGIEAVICAGESYFAGGDFQTEAGTYFDTLQSSSGCDSVIITDLIVLDASSSMDAVSICADESYFAGGDFQTESGIYFDTLSNSFGCDSIVITELTVLNELFILSDVTICNGESYFVGGDFQTESGVYFDTLASAGGCDSIVQTNLTVNSLQISGAISDVSCFGGNDGAIVLTVTGGSAPFTFQWSNNTTDKDASGLSFGSYSVTVTDSSGCSGSEGFFVEQPAPLALGAVTVPVSCNGESDGSIDLTVLGGNAPYTFEWSTGDSLEDISGLTAGFYTVIVTDSKGCQATVIIQLLEPFAVLLEGIVFDETVTGANDGAINLLVLGGAAPFVFEWSNGETTQDISGLSAGTYNVTVTDDNGCSVVGSYTINTILPPRQPGVNQSNPGEFDLFAYPNPFEDQIVVEFTADEDAAGRMILRDVLGKKVYESRIAIFKGENKQQITLDAGLLASGIYILEIVRNDETVRGVRTLIKE